jgi:hypothetical protein
VPGAVEDLTLKSGSHDIFVKWKKPSKNSYCVAQYVIDWVHTLSGTTNSVTVESEKDSLHIEGLDACVQYAVRVSAVNKYNESSGYVIGNTTTETAGNYHAQIFLLY